MLRRLVFGLLVGLAIGGLLSFGLVRLGEPVFAGTGGEMLAYLSAAGAGALTGLIAGKPIWAAGAKIEAGLKALFGALLAATGMFALQHWGADFRPDMRFLGGGGPLPIGELPAASLPLIAAVLGGLFGLDNTADKPGSDDGPTVRKQRVAAAGGVKSRVAQVEDREEAELVTKRAKR
jgi:hypothetical protein